MCKTPFAHSQKNYADNVFGRICVHACAILMYECQLPHTEMYEDQLRMRAESSYMRAYAYRRRKENIKHEC